MKEKDKTLVPSEAKLDREETPAQAAPEQGTEQSARDQGWEPTTRDPIAAVNPADAMRSLDYGDSGQFAPGGYYNQRAVTKPDRIDLDKYTATRPPDEEKTSEPEQQKK